MGKIRIGILLVCILSIGFLCACRTQEEDARIENDRFCMTAQEVCDRWNEKKLPDAERLSDYQKTGEGIYAFPLDGSEELRVGIGETGELWASVSLKEPGVQPQIERDKFRARIISLIRWSGCEDSEKIHEILSALSPEELQTEGEREIAVNGARYGFRCGKSGEMKTDRGSNRVFPSEVQRAVFWVRMPCALWD